MTSPQPRGGVYYEAGFAQGLGIAVIWMVRQDHIDNVHFDTRQFNHITWPDAADLREKLKNRIGAVLGDGPRLFTSMKVPISWQCCLRGRLLTNASS